MPFSKLLDGEITYNSFTIDGIIYNRAEEFFGNIQKKVSKKDIDIFLSSITLAKEEIGILWQSLSERFKGKPTLMSLYDDSFLDIQSKFALLENAVFIEATK
jgi:hypothetical protein